MAEKLEMMSGDIIKENIDYIASKFPNALKEVMENGKLVKKIDFDVLKQELSNVVIDDKQERYQMTWPDKKKSILLANSRINRTLRPVKEKSVDFDNTKNLYIEGDNLDVLKLLRETYLGKVKMIYIDPPYNTGNDFVYEDDFSQSSEEYLSNSGQFDDQGNRLFQNNESRGRFHTDWLNMMYPRLKLAKDFLTQDGLIFISIDDNEDHNLRKICDEIFGATNFLVEMVNITGASQNGEGVLFQKNTESCLVYAKDYSSLKINRVDKAEESLRNLNDSPSPLYTRPDMGYSIYFNPLTKEIIPVKDYDKSKISQNEETYVYSDDKDLLLKGFIPIRPGLKNGLLNRWRWGFDTFIARKDEIVIQKNGGKFSVFFTQKGFNPPKNVMNYTVGTAELKNLFDGNKVFDFPKSTKMMKYLLKIGTDTGDIVMDFFAGSSTTADATIQLNAEEKSNRNFILVQLPEIFPENSDQYKNGYITICDLGIERIRRVAHNIKNAPNLLINDVDLGLRVLKLDSSNMNEVFYNPDKYNQNLLENLIENVKEDRTSLDLLFQVMLELGIELSAKIEEKVISGKQCFVVNNNDIVACFDSGITDEVIKELAKVHSIYAVFKDYAFANDSSNINCEQIFKSISPSTTIKVI